jgi:glycosyltransferase involved in cell wall biosynthesis
MTEDAGSDAPLVTFALFAYNQERFIRAAVEGAFAQTYQPLEIILSDDCSTDRTFEIMQQMAAAYQGPHRILVRRNDKNRGLAGHINIVVGEASGELIAWAAGDDVSLRERVSLLAEPLIRDAGVIASHSPVIEIDLNGEQLRERPYAVGIDTMMLDSFIEGEMQIISQTQLFRKAVFDRFGPLDESVTNESVPMTFRELCLGHIAFVRTPTVLYRVGSGVSTYRGFDVDTCTIHEPTKIASWRFTGFSQVAKDMRFVDDLLPTYRVRIFDKLIYYNYLFHINRDPISVGSMIELIRYGLIDGKALSAFIRRNAPWIIRSAYVRNIIVSRYKHNNTGFEHDDDLLYTVMPKTHRTNYTI